MKYPELVRFSSTSIVDVFHLQRFGSRIENAADNPFFVVEEFARREFCLCRVCRCLDIEIYPFFWRNLSVSFRSRFECVGSSDICGGSLLCRRCCFGKQRRRAWY